MPPRIFQNLNYKINNFSDLNTKCFFFYLLSNNFLKMEWNGTTGGCYVFGCPAFFLIPDTFLRLHYTQKMKFSIKDFFSKCDQIHSFLRIWLHLLKKSLMENFIICAVLLTQNLSTGKRFFLQK